MEHQTKYEALQKEIEQRMVNNMYTGKNFIIVELCIEENMFYGPFATVHSANSALDRLLMKTGKPRNEFSVVELRSV